MNKSEDPMARLRDANPVPLDEAPSADSPQAVAMFERIVATPPDAAPPATVRPFRRSLRRRLWVLIPAAIVAGAAGYAATHHGEPAAGIACWAKASMDDGTDRGDGDLSMGDPISACARLWAPDGGFNPSGSIHSPRLTACVNDDGIIAVFPDDFAPDTCGHLGLSPYDGGEFTLQDDPAVQLREQLSQVLVTCHSSDEAVGIAVGLLKTLHLDSWKTQVISSGREDEPCASFILHPEIETVRLRGG